MLNVPTPMIRSIIGLASVMHGVDYWAEGRTVERLGIKGMSVKDIRFLVMGVEPAATSATAGTDVPAG
jgi:opine dehydrogenase